MPSRSRVLDYIKKNINTNNSLHADGDKIRTKLAIQHLTSLRLKDKEDQAIYENVIQHALGAESECPGSGLLYLKKLVQDSHDSVAPPRNKSEALELVRNMNYRPFVQTVLGAILEIADASSKIVLKKSSTSEAYLEVSHGYNFQIESASSFKKTLKYTNVKFACIDGYIESVSEIHHLLEFLSSHQLSCILVVRGLSDDVRNTIEVNNERGTLKTQVVLSKYDIENVNSIVDIAIVTGTDVVSSLKGQLISSAQDYLGFAEEVVLDRTSMRVKNKSTFNSVQMHLANIKDSMSNKEDVVKPAYEKRIRSLTSSCIDVCVPDDINHYSTMMQLSEGIRTISAILAKRYDPDTVAQKYYDSYSAAAENTLTLLL